MKSNRFTIAAASVVALAIFASPALAGSKNKQRYSGPPPCLDGYQFYPDKGECIRVGPITPNSRLAQKAPCKPGEVRRTDPDDKGTFKIQTCGFVPRGK